MFTIREFAKNGFKRREDLDFRDDGNFFRCWSYESNPDIKVTYLKSDNEYYLDMDIDISNKSFTHRDMFKTDWYRLTGEFNGVKDIDFDKFISNIDTVIAGIEDLDNQIKNYKPDMKELKRYQAKEIELAENAVAYFKANYDWFNKDNWNLKWDISRVKTLMGNIEQIKNVDLSTLSNKKIRELEQNIQENGCMYYCLNAQFIYDLCKEN